MKRSETFVHQHMEMMKWEKRWRKKKMVCKLKQTKKISNYCTIILFHILFKSKHRSWWHSTHSPCSKLSFIWVWSSGWKKSKHDFPSSSGGVYPRRAITRWSTNVNFPSIEWREMNSALLLAPLRSLVLGVDVTCRRPIATRQQWEAWPSSSAPRSICTPATVKSS